MATKGIITSHYENSPKAIIIFKVRSILYAVVGLLFGFVFGFVVTPIFKPAGIICPIACGVGLFSFSEWLYSGKYYNERIEIIIGKLKQKFTNRKIRLSKEPNLRFIANNTTGKDVDSLDDILGNEIFGFEIVQNNEVDFQNNFKSMVANLLKDLPFYDQIQFVRVCQDVEERFESRKILNDLKAKNIKYFLFFSLFAGENKNYKQKILRSLQTSSRRLTRKEISLYCEKIYQPTSKPKDQETPIYTLSYFFQDKYIEAFSNNNIFAASSLAKMPQIVDEDFFCQFLSPLDPVDSVVCITFNGVRSIKSAAKEIFTVLRHDKLEKKKSNEKRLDAYDKMIMDKDEGRSINVTMNFNIVVFGNKDVVENCLNELENKADSCSELERRPIFFRETVFIKDTFYSISAGSRSGNLYRKLNVISVDEAIRYLPMPPMQEQRGTKRDFVFRMEDNTVWGFPYYEPMTTLIVGKPGFGKSLAAGLIFNHHLLSPTLGYRASGFILDLGQSFAFLEDGLADFTFKLEYDQNKGKYNPLQIHPLNLFKPFGDKIKYAKKFLCSVMGFDPENPALNTATDGEVVIEALREFYEKNLERMSDFRFILIGKLSLFFDRISNKEVKKANWDEYIARLNYFCKGGLCGDIFDPEKTIYDEKNLKDIHFFYAVKTTDSKDDVALIKAFATLVLEFANLLEEKFKTSVNNEPSNFFYCVDEMNWWRDFIPHSWYRERASQNRKFGASLWLLTQHITDLIIPKSILEEAKMADQYSLLYSVQRCFFYTLDKDFKALSIIARENLESSRDELMKNGRISKMFDIEKKIAEVKRQCEYGKSMSRLVGYVDDKMNLMALYVDVDKEFVWASTTHNGGRAIRRKALKYAGLSYFETCNMLAQWPGKIPENQLTEDYENDILRTVFHVDKLSFNKSNKNEEI